MQMDDPPRNYVENAKGYPKRKIKIEAFEFEEEEGGKKTELTLEH